MPTVAKLIILNFNYDRALDSCLDELVERKTKGRGGARIGAGRPKGSKKSAPTKTVRLKATVAEWAKSHSNEIERIREGDLIVVAAKPYDHKH